jgi:uncharacterized protein (TIGR02271 family)
MTVAQQVVRALQNGGFRREDISIVAGDKAGEYGRQLSRGEGAGESVADGAATGAGVGATLGGLGGLLVGLGALAIPGVGPIIAAGPIAAALAGAGIGAVAGGLLGALIDAGVPEDEANLYHEGVRRGGVLVMVNAQDHMADQAADIMDRFNPIDVDKRSADWESSGWQRTGSTTATTGSAAMAGGMTSTTGTHSTTGTDRDRIERERMERERHTSMDREGEKHLPIVEEEMRVGKREVRQGGVRVHTRMEEHPVEEDVTLRRERVEVERRPADRPASQADLDAFKEGSFDVTETSEEAVVDKQARVTGEVVVRKDVDEHTETVRDTVRRTDVDTENLTSTGRTGTTGSRFSSFETYDPEFRQHYQTSFSSSGRDYTFYQPAYRYGYDLAGNERYRNSEWSQVESDARREWERRNPQNPWEDFKDAVREGWDRVRGRR